MIFLLSCILKSCPVLVPLTVHENDGSQPIEPLLCVVPGMRHLPLDHHHHPHTGAEVRQCATQKRRLYPFPLLLRLRFEHPGLQLPDQLLLRQDLHRRPERQPHLHPLLLPLHCGQGHGDFSQLLAEERPGEELSYLLSGEQNGNMTIRKFFFSDMIFFCLLLENRFAIIMILNTVY